MMSGRTRFPFTASQWQELEHQALIFKYMASGIPIPPDLLFTIKRSCLDSPLSSKYLPHQPQHIGWNYLQMGLGRKIDPEPGRCRRTDGKKWRCSKEAFPDSKYCERHMHRGKNRSRKPVEVLKTTSTNTNPSTPTISSSITKNHSALTPTSRSLSSLSTVSSEPHHHPHHSYYSTHFHHPFIYHPTSSSRPSGIGLPPQDNNSPYLLESASYSSQTNTDYRYINGLKEEVDEHAFFSEPSGSMRSLSGPSMDDSWQLTPLTMSTSCSKQRGCSGLQSEYSYLQLQSLSDSTKQPEQDHQHCFVLGSNIKNEMPIEIEKEQQPQKTVHRFFDEWPPKERDNSWLDLDDKSSNSSSVSTTRLSISVPTSFHDFPIFNSRSHNGN
ncbi:growth-regulating factor 1 isoform X3 [Corylus avellana]|uniref:growth-regulating factor 1 isoform X3 n=1 Tax=Corylus avellana TaxID=13451 RepID=UPI00286A5ABC|nr:growth-regulating factor 1 isoform X3 [Corylus avellana]